CAYVWLRAPGAPQGGAQPQEEEGERVQGQADVAEGDDDAPDQHGPPLADEPVGDPPPRQGRQGGHGGVEAVEGTRLGGIPAQPSLDYGGGHEEEEDGPHAVVDEALPPLGDE